MSAQAHILPSSQIDAVKWDTCVAGNRNGMIYASTTYLHAMADSWHGIVLGDYRAVMPVPWRIKFGFRYAYMPAFTQQLGLTGNYTTEDLGLIFNTVAQFVSLADIHFNFLNTEAAVIGKMEARTNLVLDLSQGYDLINGQYRKDLKENIRNTALFYQPIDTMEDAVRLFKDQYASRTPHVKDADYAHFAALCRLLSTKDQCFVRCMQDNDGNKLAVSILLKDQRRIYNIMNSVTAAGRKHAANDLLFDRILHEFAGQQVCFDFEGSELPGVKAFYEKFGAVNQPYFRYRYNGLPWPLKLFK